MGPDISKIENEYLVAKKENPPQDCVSITTCYGRAPDSENWAFTIPNSDIGYLPYFRAFIPPGTFSIDLFIIEGGNQMAVARHKVPPTGYPTSPPAGYVPVSNFKLQELVAGDKWATESMQGYLHIAKDRIQPPIPIADAGWLYARVEGGQPSSIYQTNFIVKVNTAVYNTWWDQYIKDETGWEKSIQSVLTYVPVATAPEIYTGSASGIDISVELTRETATDGMALITVGVQANKMAYKTWTHDGVQTIYVVGIGYLEIVGNTLKVNTFSGVTLEKQQ